MGRPCGRQAEVGNALRKLTTGVDLGEFGRGDDFERDSFYVAISEAVETIFDLKPEPVDPPTNDEGITDAEDTPNAPETEVPDEADGAKAAEGTAEAAHEDGPKEYVEGGPIPEDVQG